MQNTTHPTAMAKTEFEQCAGICHTGEFDASPQEGIFPPASVPAGLTPTYTLTKHDARKGRTVSRVFVGAEELVAYIASLGPDEVEDKAAGFLHPHDPSVMCLPLNAGQCALIDAEDYPLAKGYLWMLHGEGRVQANTCVGGEIFVHKLHRIILMLGTEDERVGDHINHDPLDNRKSNLRTCTQQQNTFNTRLSKANTSGVKGVYKFQGRWRGKVKVNGVESMGSFGTIEEAEAWVREKRVELHGEFACHG